MERRISEVCVKEGARFVLRASVFIIKNNENFNFVIYLFQVMPFSLQRVNLRVGLAKKALRKTPRSGGEQL